MTINTDTFSYMNVRHTPIQTTMKSVLEEFGEVIDGSLDLHLETDPYI